MVSFLNLGAYLAVAVFNDQEHRGVLGLHGSVQRLNAHAVLCSAKDQCPWVPDGPRREIPGKLCAGKINLKIQR